jgi:hypothetical protein
VLLGREIAVLIILATDAVGIKTTPDKCFGFALLLRACLAAASSSATNSSGSVVVAAGVFTVATATAPVAWPQTFTRAAKAPVVAETSSKTTSASGAITKAVACSATVAVAARNANPASGSAGATCASAAAGRVAASGAIRVAPWITCITCGTTSTSAIALPWPISGATSPTDTATCATAARFFSTATAITSTNSRTGASITRGTIKATISHTNAGAASTPQSTTGSATAAASATWNRCRLSCLNRVVIAPGGIGVGEDASIETTAASSAGASSRRGNAASTIDTGQFRVGAAYVISTTTLHAGARRIATGVSAVGDAIEATRCLPNVSGIAPS